MNPLIVLYYHRILPFKGYDVDIETFERQLFYIKKRFDIVGTDALIDVLGGKSLKKPSVLITFDDGFLDNFVYAYPLLKRYSAKAVIFIATSKVQNGGRIRKTLDDYWSGKTELKEIFVPNKKETALYDSLNGDFSEFLNWDELNIMKDSGIFKIGSHGHIHSKIFSSSKVCDFYHKDATIHWSFIYANNGDLNVGSPIFEMKSSLAAKKFIPSDDFKCIVKDAFNKAYKKSKDYNVAKKSTLAIIGKYKDRGFFENSDDFESRVFNEMVLSKKLIKEHLNIDTKLLSWPWGEFSNESLKLAKKAGFEYCFSTKKDFVRSTHRCKIGRIKASGNKNRFEKRLFIYSKPVLANIYNRFHL